MFFRTSIIALMLAFVVGGSIMFLTGIFWYTPFAPSLQIVIADNVVTQPHELTFESWGVIACGGDSTGRVSYSSSRASDGAILHSTWVYKIENEARTRKRFMEEIRGATRLIEQDPTRALFEKDGEVVSISYRKNVDSSDNSYSLLILKAPSLKHIVDYETQQASLETSMRVNHLN